MRSSENRDIRIRPQLTVLYVRNMRVCIKVRRGASVPYHLTARSRHAGWRAILAPRSDAIWGTGLP